MQRLIERACAERDLAYAEAVNWKQRYEREAKQRREERSQFEAQFEAHSSDQLRQGAIAGGDRPESSLLESEDCQADLFKLEALAQKIKQLELELEQERINHQKTKTSLINALGDALHRKQKE